MHFSHSPLLLIRWGASQVQFIIIIIIIIILQQAHLIGPSLKTTM